MKNKNQKGRSMIEMLGVLGIMAVITVLGILVYQLALKNSKMNKLKQDVANISQALDQSYSRQKFTDTGVVLGTDRTFDNMFVDTNFFKSATTPFGGTYSLTGISQDLFELKVTGPEESDCKYMVSDDSFLKRLEKATLACEDENGLIHYAANNPNNPGAPVVLPPEVQALIDNNTAAQLQVLCVAGDNNACIATALAPDATQVNKYVGCQYSGGNETACAALVADPTASTLYLSSACSSSTISYAPACEAALANENSTASELQSICVSGATSKLEGCIATALASDATAYNKYVGCQYSGGNETACAALVADPTANTLYLATACSSSTISYAPACEAALANENSKASELQSICVSGATSKLEGCIATALASDATAYNKYVGCQYSGGNETACEALVADPTANTLYLATACSSSTISYAPACDAVVSNENSTVSDLQSVCVKGTSSKQEACIATALAEDATQVNKFVGCQYSGGDETACAAFVADPSASVSYLASACKSSTINYTPACTELCNRGETSYCN